MFRKISVYGHAIVTTPVGPLGLIARGTVYSTRSPLPSDGGLPRNAAGSAPTSLLFEACSTFTRVMACPLAERL